MGVREPRLLSKKGNRNPRSASSVCGDSLAQEIVDASHLGRVSSFVGGSEIDRSSTSRRRDFREFWCGGAPTKTGEEVWDSVELEQGASVPAAFGPGSANDVSREGAEASRCSV